MPNVFGDARFLRASTPSIHRHARGRAHAQVRRAGSLIINTTHLRRRNGRLVTGARIDLLAMQTQNLPMSLAVPAMRIATEFDRPSWCFTLKRCLKPGLYDLGGPRALALGADEIGPRSCDERAMNVR